MHQPMTTTLCIDILTDSSRAIFKNVGHRCPMHILLFIRSNAEIPSSLFPKSPTHTNPPTQNPRLHPNPPPPPRRPAHHHPPPPTPHPKSRHSPLHQQPLPLLPRRTPTPPLRQSPRLSQLPSLRPQSSNALRPITPPQQGPPPFPPPNGFAS